MSHPITTSHLFEPLTLRDITLRNRIAVSPMCMYSSEEGFATDWHLVHLGSRAVGGAGLVITEATAVVPEGRISPHDLGIWQDAHIEKLSQVTRFVQEHGAVAGIQLAHAGRKASTNRPWGENAGRPLPTDDARAWPTVAPSAVPFSEAYRVPNELSEPDIRGIIRAFGEAAQRALTAGFQVVELHAAHGYLLHEFLSPLSNQRTDGYGGDFAGRTRFVREVTEEVRRFWPERLPLLVRISASDWTEGGWDVEQSVELARLLQGLCVDLIDCSSGGNIARVKIPVGPGYQTLFAERIRRETGMPTGAVGAITSATQADHILRTGQADIVLLARELLRDPYWPLRAAKELGKEAPVPAQYTRAW